MWRTRLLMLLIAISKIKVLDHCPVEFMLGCFGDFRDLRNRIFVMVFFALSTL